MVKRIVGFIADTSGATVIEYGLIASLIAVAIIAAVSTIGGKMNNTFKNIGSSLKGS